jgi:Tol biopolymer transport system component
MALRYGTLALLSLCLLLGACGDKASIAVPLAGATLPATIQRVSVSSSGAEAVGTSTYAWLSENGRFVSFLSSAGNLVPGDTNGANDGYLHDTVLGTTVRVSVGSGGVEGTGATFSVSTSGTGRYVVFSSTAPNLVPGDTNALEDVFVHDTYAGTTKRVSVNNGGLEGNNASTTAFMSPDGRFFAFTSLATLDTDGSAFSDIFLRDEQLGTTRLESVDSGGLQASGNSSQVALSADASVIAYQSIAGNLVPGDTNGVNDIMVRNRPLGITFAASARDLTTTNYGNAASNNPSISGDGRYVVFETASANLIGSDANAVVDIYLRDTATNRTLRISEALGGGDADFGSFFGSISADGRFVAFASAATNLTPDVKTNGGAADIFVRDWQTGATARLSQDVNGVDGDNNSNNPRISADGRYVVFESLSSNLVPNDTNGLQDVFLVPNPLFH